MQKKFLILFLTVAFAAIVKCAKMNPVTVKTQMNVKDTDGMKFLQIRVRKDGKPIGIFYKKTTSRTKKNNRVRRNVQQPDEIIEIIGTRESDTEHDKHNIYRNAMIVNNTLVQYPSNYRPHKMEKSNIMNTWRK